MENIFVTGANVKEGHPKTPWIKARMGFNDKFIEFFNQHKDEKGWMNVDLCLSKDNKYYLKLNTYKTGEVKENNPPTREEITNSHSEEDGDIPF